MLLDRRRIRKWARWVALILAIIFCVGAVGIGVGSGVDGMNVLDALSCSNDNTTNTTAAADRIAALLAAVTQNPKDLAALQSLATAYQENGDYTNAVKYLEQAIAVDPTQKTVYLALANIYESNLYDYSSAVKLLNRAIAQFPEDPDMYLALGLAQRSAGNASAAVMAWQKYLQLAPNGDQASAIKQAIADIAAQATTTTSTAGTTTTTAGTTSTAGSTTTTAGTTSSSTP